jgi:hypothetical protein
MEYKYISFEHRETQVFEFFCSPHFLSIDDSIGFVSNHSKEVTHRIMALRWSVFPLGFDEDIFALFRELFENAHDSLLDKVIMGFSFDLEISVSVKASYLDQQIIIEIVDNGAGIDSFGSEKKDYYRENKGFPYLGSKGKGRRVIRKILSDLGQPLDNYNEYFSINGAVITITLNLSFDNADDPYGVSRPAFFFEDQFVPKLED